jgi:hypothetical protein
MQTGDFPATYAGTKASFFLFFFQK